MFDDAPVSGGEAGAQKGQLTVMCGGDEAAYAKAEPVIRAYAKMCRLMGPAGAGQKTKMVNQICIAGLVQALSEGIAFAEKAGLDPIAVVDVISKGAAQSWQMENRAATMHRAQIRLRLRRRMDAQRPPHHPRRGPQERRAASGHRPRRPILRRRRTHGRQTLGYVEPDRAAYRKAEINFAARGAK